MENNSLTHSILKHLEKYAWPSRPERILRTSNSLQETYDLRVETVAKLIEANDFVNQEWATLQGSTTPENVNNILERVRFHGLNKTIAYVVGAYLRSNFDKIETKSKKKELNYLKEPFRYWNLLESIFEGDENHHHLMIECAVILELFSHWLDELTRSEGSPASANRSKKWLDTTLPSWKPFWKKLVENKKSGSLQTLNHIFRAKIAIDIGKATLVARFEKTTQLWTECAKSEDSPEVIQWKENRALGIHSALIAAIWSQGLGTWSSLAIPLRLLLRPWQVPHSQLHPLHSEIVAYFCENNGEVRHEAAA